MQPKPHNLLLYFFLQIPWEAHRKIKDMYSQSWLDFGWAFKIFFHLMVEASR